MTYQEFLKKLAETPRDWYLTTSARMIRRPASGSGLVGCECPVSSLAHLCVGDYNLAADRIGLKFDLMWRILRAADNDSKFGDPVIRRDLLRACGLSQ